MSVILRARIIFALGVKRLVTARYQAAMTAVGLILIVGLATSIPIYSDGIHYRLLLEEIPEVEYGDRPPFTFLFRYVSDGGARIKWTDVWSADGYITTTGYADLGLPQQDLIRYFASNTFFLFPSDVLQAAGADPVAWASFAFAGDLVDHIDVLRGDFPLVSAGEDTESMGVLISEGLAEKSSLEVGDEFVAYDQSEMDAGQPAAPVPIHVAGVWRASDSEDPFWFYSPKVLEDVMFVPERTFVDLARSGEIEPNVVVWYLLMDGSGIHAEDVAPLLQQIGGVKEQMASLLPGASLSISPESALKNYHRATRELFYVLHASSVPSLGILLIYVSMVTRQAMERRRYEHIVLHCRGAGPLQVAGVAVLESVIVAVPALAAGLLVGRLGAWLIGGSQGFLGFDTRSELRVGWTATAMRFGLAAVGLALAVQVMPIIRAAARTAPAFKDERVRALRWPWWHRAWLDLLLLVPAAFGYYVLDWRYIEPLRTPLFLLVPSAAVLALTLLALRVLPLIMSVVAWMASRVRGTGLFLAARYLAYTSALHAAPLALLVMTLSLSILAASLAKTLNHRLHDQVYYRVGADMLVRELGQSSEKEPYRPHVPLGEGEELGKEQRWVFRPVSEYVHTDGVEAAARVGRYSATARLGGGAQSGEFLGVDHWNFDSTAFWRDEFASASLGSLMDALASQPNGVLVPADFLQVHNLAIGDTLQIRILAYGGVAEAEMKIVGAFEAFPTWYGASEGRGTLFVGNLYSLFGRMGTQLPHDVWLKVEPDADRERVMEEVEAIGVQVLAWESSPDEIAQEQHRPDRQGLLGTLSIGVLATGILTIVGFWFHAAHSFRRRFIELRVLHAIGMSTRQMMAFLGWELAILLLVGLTVGTALGVGGSQLFIAHLNPGSGLFAVWPYSRAQIAWPVVLCAWAVGGVLLLVSIGGLRALLPRIEASRAARAGEAA